MATSKAFVTNESELKINGEAGADHAWSMEGTETATAQCSIQIDLGARPAAYLISWNCEMAWQGTPTVGGTCDFYVAGAPDATAANIDGDIGSSDADLGTWLAGAKANCTYIGSVTVDTADTSDNMSSGSFVWYGRYISFIGETYIPIVNEGLIFGECLEHSLLTPNQMRTNGITVEDTPTQFDCRSKHAVIGIDDCGKEVTLLLMLRGIISYRSTQ